MVDGELTSLSALLSPEDREQAEAFSGKINLHDSAVLMNYGASAQKNLTAFSDGAMRSVRNKELDSVGDLLEQLLGELKDLDADGNKSGLFGIFRKENPQKLRARYTQAEEKINRIASELERQQISLMKDIAMLDRMYEQNQKCCRELTMYLLAGKQRLAAVRSGELEALRIAAERSGRPEDEQKYDDLLQKCDYFDKKLYDLELSRMVSLQMGPQMRLLQSSDTALVDKIRSAIHHTLPLWKGQMLLAVGAENARQAASVQDSVAQVSDTLLHGGAERLRADVQAGGTPEELRQTNKQLIAMLDEVLRIQRDGVRQRTAAESQLRQVGSNDTSPKTES